MYNINSHINVNFFQKTTERSRERSASHIIKFKLAKLNNTLNQKLKIITL